MSSCPKLKTITLSKNLTSIESNFNVCSELESLYIGPRVTDIGTICKRNYALKTIRCDAMTPPTIDSEAFDNVTIKNIQLSVPSPAVNAYKAATFWKGFKIVGHDDYNYLGDVDGDEVINVSDVTALVSKILGNATYSDTVCDINYDNVVDVSDVTALIAIMLGGN